MAVDGSYSFDPATEKDSRSRRRRIAEQLMAQGMETTPIQSPWQGAARMAQALMGGIELGMEDKKEREMMAAQNAHNSSIAKDIFGGGAPSASPVTAALAGKPMGGPIKLGGFEPTVARTLEFEGGLNPRDTNGTPSNFGINAKANPDVDVMNLTPQGATEIYRKRYWDAIGADKLDPRTAHVAFDTAVIAGPGKAKELLQASGGDPEKFLALREAFQNRLLAANPEKYGPYAKAWANRTATLRSDVGVGGGGAQPGGLLAFGGQPGPAGPIQVAQAGGQTMNDGNARIQQLYAKAIHPMTSPANKTILLAEIKRLQDANDPDKIQQRRLTDLQMRKAERDLNTPAAPTTVEVDNPDGSGTKIRLQYDPATKGWSPLAAQNMPTPPAGPQRPNQKVIDGEGKLRDDFNKERPVEAFQKTTQAFQNIRDAYTQSVNAAQEGRTLGAADLTMVYSFMKMLDPGSTVMQGEYATAQNAPGIQEQIRAQYNRLIKGGYLSEQGRKDFLIQAGEIYNGRLGEYKKTAGSYKNTATEYGYEPRRVITRDDYRSFDGFYGPETAPEPSKGGAPGARKNPDDVSPDEALEELRRRGVKK